MRRSFGIDLPLRAVFEASTVAALAERIGTAGGGAERPAIERLPRPLESGIPLSFAQERLWFLDRLQPGSAAYVMPAALRLSGLLDAAALGRAFDGVARRHAILRAVFADSEGAPAQSILPFAPLAMPVIDLAGLPAERREPEASRIARAASREPFDLETGPLLRLRLLKLAETEHLAVLTLHHIAADGWSLGVLAREVAALYRGEALPEPPVQYADFAAWQRGWLAGGVLDAQLDWWRGRLAGAPEVLELPADHPRPALPTLRGGSRAVAIPAALAGRLRDAARREGATLFLLLLAAFQTLLHRLTGEDDLSVGTPVAGRTRIETEGLIGLFVNTLALRGDLSGDPPFRALLARAREGFLAAHAHQDLPFEKLVEALRPERGLDRSPLFQVLFVLQNAAGEPARLPGLELRPEALPAGGAKLDLSLSLSESPEGLTGLIEYAADLFDAVTVARWESHFATLLTGIADGPDLPLSALPLLSEAELHQLRVEWCDTAAEDRLDGLCLHALLAEAAERSPDDTAVVSDSGGLTYAELDRWSRGLAARLRREGIGPGAFVPLLMDSGPGLVAGMLAAMRAGAAFVPLDVEWPAARLEEVLAELADVSRGVVLVDEASPPAPAARLALCVEGERESLADGLPDPALADPESPIYAIYTSGSTGRPKAVVVPHRGIVNRFLWMDRRFGAGAARRVLQTTRCVYDSAVWQIFWPLIQGGRTVLTPARLGLDPESLAGLIERHGITMADFVPSVFNLLVERLESGSEPVDRLATLRAVVVGGEEMEIGAARAFRRLLPDVRLVNLYGPTEASIGCICHTVGDERGGRVPIGRPISNVAPRVLDSRGGPVPVGVAGELLLAGRCVGQGYLGDGEKTRRAFVADPLGGDGPAYRTGDRARWLPDGRLDFLGRIDQQVKIRGLRIEPGEIEAALRRHPAVSQAAVLAVGEGARRRLAAYVVPGGAVSGRELRGFLADRLPAALVPASFVLLESLPLSAGGKVDRRALAALAPEPDGGEEAFAAPRSPAEEVLAGIWAEVLGADRPVGIHDDFFALGGHSLLATRVISRVRRAFGVELPVRALFEEPTVAGLARRVTEEAGSGAPPPVVPVPRGRGLPLSFAQQRLWFLERLQSGGALYNLLLAARLTGPLDPGRLGRALEEVARRHESLRTSFPETADGPVQAVAPPGPVPLPLADLASLPPAAREAEVSRRIAAEARNPFDLGAGPLLRCGLLRLGEEDHALLVGVHHTVCDGWSIGLLERELGIVYGALSRGEARLLPELLPELPVQYADYAIWQRGRLSGEARERETAWWRSRLAGMPAVVELPADRLRPPVQSFRGARLPMEIPDDTAGALRALGRRQGSTLFMVLLAALDALLLRYTGEERLTVGTPTANRGALEVEPLIGNFANTLALPVSLEGDPELTVLLERVREAVLAAFAHQELPFELLVEALSPQRDLSHNPLFQVLFGLHGLPPRRGRLGDLVLEPLPVESGSARFDLALDLTDPGAGGLRGAFEYATDLFDRPTVERLGGHLRTLLDGALAHPRARLSELPLLTGAERRQLLEEGDGGPPETASAATLHEMVERQARLRPDAVAVVCGGERLTYGALDRRANALARRLRGLGIGPESLVGVHVERSAELPVALLGVLKAGGAYVPLDPSYPAQRVARILRSAAPAVLVRGRSESALPEHGAAEVWLDALDPEEAADPPAVRMAPSNLAYVIYTSGSTGQPKGVQVAHAGVVHLMEVARRRHALGENDTSTVFHSFAFDFSVWEIWGALTSGGRLVVVPLETAREPERLRGLLERERVTVLNLTPSALRALAEVSDGPPSPALRLLMCGGEAFPDDLAPRLRSWDAEVWNYYGPTEATVWASAGPLDGAASLGSPLPSYRLSVADRAGQPLPLGVPGELGIAGTGVARGYFRDPAQTAERFAPDPSGGEPGGRVYRTGDLARRLSGGGLEFLGRIDHQVKIRGFRIELGEIEAALAAHPAVEQAAVVSREEGAGRRLVAFLAGGARASAGELRSFLAERLPDYMVPSAFAWLESLPLSPSGKVDRRRLAALAPDLPEADGRGALGTPVEEILAGIWSAVLRTGGIGARDDFFSLGGHSLLATQVVSRARSAFGVELPLRAVFEAPTLAGLAARIEAAMGSGAAAPPLRPVPREGVLPLSFSQERLWFLDQLQPGSALYNIPAAFRVAGSLSPALLEAVLTEVVRRHEVLSTRFESAEGRPGQRIGPARPFPVPVADLSGLPAEARAAELAFLSEREARRPFDLERDLLLRAVLVDLAPAEQAVLFVLHHIAGDGWSLGVLTREVVALYEAFLAGRPSPLPDLPVQYADFAAWQRGWLSGEALEAQVSHWRARLAGVPTVLDLPTDRPRPPVQDFRGGREVLRLPRDLSEALRSLARREGATLFMVLLASFQVLLSRHARQDRLVVGTPVANRGRQEIEGLIGFFVNTLALAGDLSGDPAWRELLGRVREESLGAYAHQDLPFEKLVEELEPQRDLTTSPLFQVMLVLQNVPREALELP
ncbi:MAG: amino acid adenylation domain-containing protein, partial [Acidobacteriota bacterium]